MHSQLMVSFQLNFILSIELVFSYLNILFFYKKWQEPFGNFKLVNTLKECQLKLSNYNHFGQFLSHPKEANNFDCVTEFCRKNIMDKKDEKTNTTSC